MNTAHKFTFRVAVAATGASIALAAIAPAAFAATSIKSLSVTSGSALGGAVVTITGTDLATDTSCAVSPACPAGIAAPVVKFGDNAADPATVRAFSSSVVQVTVPDGDAGKVAVSVDPDGAGAAAAVSKAGAFTYTPSVPTATATAGVLTGTGSSTADTAGLTIAGTGLKDATVTVGGKKAAVTASTNTLLTYTAPKDLMAGYQPVIIKTKGGTIDAGVLQYVAPIPTITSIKLGSATGDVIDQVANNGASTIVVEGTNLLGVTGAVIKDNAVSSPKADQKLAVVKGATDTSLTLTVKKGLLAIADGDLVLTTKYSTSVANNFSNLDIVSVGAPTLSPLALGDGGSLIRVAGTNLDDVSAVKFNGAAVTVNATNVSNSTATGFDLKVPAYSLTGTTATKDVAIEVTTPGGVAKGKVTVTKSAALITASADLANQKVFLASSAPLTPASSSTDLKNQFISKKNPAGANSAIAADTVTVTASGVELTYPAGTFAAGDVIGVTYAAGGDTVKLKGTATTPAVVPGVALTATVAAVPTVFTSASVAGSVVTITGTNFATTNQVVFTPATGNAVTKTGSDITVNPAKTSITVNVPTTPGTYKLSLNTTVGGAAVDPTTAPALITVAPIGLTYTGLSYDGTNLVVSGTALNLATIAATVDNSGTPAAVSGLTWALNGDKTQATAAFTPTTAKTYTVTVKKTSDDSNIAVSGGGAATLAYTTPTFTGATYAAGAGTITVAGTGLKAAGITLENSSNAAVTGITWVVNSGGTSAVGTPATPLTAGTYTAKVKSGANIAVSGGGSAGITVTAAPTLSSMVANSTAKTVTITASAALTNVSSLSGTAKAQFVFKKTPSGGSESTIAADTVAVNGTTITATFPSSGSDSFGAGDAITATYTQSSTAGDRLIGASSGPEVPSKLTGLSATAAAPAATFTGVSRNATTGVVTITGTNLVGTEYVSLSGTGGYTTTHPTVSGSGTSLTFTPSPALSAAGTYTVDLKTSSSGTAIGSSQTFTVTAGTLSLTSAAANGGSADTVVLSGTNLTNKTLSTAEKAQFTISVGGNAVAAGDVTSIVVSGGNTITATLADGQIASGNTVTVAYTASGSDALVDGAGAAIANLAAGSGVTAGA